MILTVLRVKTSPRKVGEMVQALRVLLRSARAETGFITGDLYTEVDNANSISYEERWEGVQNLDEQLRSSRYTRMLTLMESAIEQPSLEFYFVSEVRGLEYVAAIRGEG